MQVLLLELAKYTDIFYKLLCITAFTFLISFKTENVQYFQLSKNNMAIDAKITLLKTTMIHGFW